MRKGVFALAASAIALLTGPAVAQGVCVECKGPERGYRCTVKDAERAQQFRGGQRALEFLCISEIARAGGHQSCRVSTGYSGPCIGQPHEIDVAQLGKDNVVGGRPPGAEDGAPGSQAGAAVGPSDPPAKGPVKKGPPETLEELARETVAKSKAQLSNADEGVKKAGSAVGGAVKQTWDCLASLFKRC